MVHRLPLVSTIPLHIHLAMNRHYLKLLSIATLTLLWVAEWYLLTWDTRVLDLSPPTFQEHIQSPSFKVAIIGAGVGGSSSAFWISLAAQRANLNIDMDLYESSGYVGGRSLSTQVTDGMQSSITIERGAYLFDNHARHLLRASKEFNLPLQATSHMDRDVYFWNGKNLLSMTVSFGDLLNFVWHYGFSAFRLSSIEERACEAVNRFSRVYKRDFAAWERSSELVHRLRLTDLLTSTLSDHFLQAGASKNLVADIFVPLNSGVTGYPHPMHTLQSAFQISSLGTDYCVVGGTRQIFEEFVSRSGASLLLNNTVKNISREADTHRWLITSTSGIKEYDAVIFAAPYHQTRITIPDGLSRQIPQVSYSDVYVTVLETLYSSVNRSFLGFPSGEGDIHYMLTSAAGRSKHITFTHLFFERKTDQGNWIVRIVSESPLSDAWLMLAFNGSVNWVFRQKWNQPQLEPTLDLSPITLSQGFYYLNGFESIISSMETQIVASQNIVNLLLRDRFGHSVCGNAQMSDNGTGNEFIAGWDC